MKSMMYVLGLVALFAVSASAQTYVRDTTFNGQIKTTWQKFGTPVFGNISGYVTVDSGDSVYVAFGTKVQKDTGATRRIVIYSDETYKFEQRRADTLWIKAATDSAIVRILISR